MAARHRGSLHAGRPVDRDDELAALDSSLAAASAGAGDCVLIEGSAGLGKSRLLYGAAALAEARGLRVIKARASQGDRNYPFGLTLRLFEPVLAAMPETARAAMFAGSAGLAATLLTADQDDDGEGAARQQATVLHGLYWLVLNIAADGPLLLTVDDVQWADEASVQFLLYLAERLEDSPVAMFGAARPRRVGEAVPLTELRLSPAVTVMPLAPLTPAGMTELVRRSRPALDADTSAAWVELADGNPFYLREALLSLDGGAADLTPAGIRDLGATSLARAAVFRLLGLGPGPVALAGALAVLGEQSTLSLAGTLAGLPLPEAAAAADELAAEQLISSGAELEFLHPLIGQSIYAEMPPARRAVAHATAALLLRKAGAPAERVATQLLAAPAGTIDWAGDTLRLAAERAMAQGAPHSAVKYLSCALSQVGDDTTSRVELLTALGRVQTAAGLADAVPNLRAALAQQQDPAGRLQVARLLSRACAHSGDHPSAAAVLEQALDQIGPGTEWLRPGLLADYLSYSTFAPELRQRSIERVTPLLREPPDAQGPDARAMLAALAMRSGQSWQPNSRTIDLADRAWHGGALLDDEGGDAAWLMTVWAYELAEDRLASLRVCTAAIAAARSVGSVDTFAAASYFHGFASLGVGQIAAALADADQAIAAAGTGRHRYLVPPRCCGQTHRSNVAISLPPKRRSRPPTT